MNMRYKKLTGFLPACAALLAIVAFDTHAVPCIAGSLTPSVACQDGIDNNDFLSNPLTVNSEMFFGFSDWEYLQKQNAGGALETMVDVGWTVTPDAPGWPSDTGSWSFDASVWSTYEDVMIVLKTGNSSGTFFSGYLLDNMAMDIAGTWDTGGKDISHLSVYARGDSDGPGGGDIPEPATLGLIAVGLLGARYSKNSRRV